MYIGGRREGSDTERPRSQTGGELPHTHTTHNTHIHIRTDLAKQGTGRLLSLLCFGGCFAQTSTRRHPARSEAVCALGALLRRVRPGQTTNTMKCVYIRAIDLWKLRDLLYECHLRIRATLGPVKNGSLAFHNGLALISEEIYIILQFRATIKRRELLTAVLLTEVYFHLKS